MRSYAELYLHYEEEMTELLMRETGKPVSLRAHRTNELRKIKRDFYLKADVNYENL